MKILVTGSAGFIAGYLVEDLLLAGHKVIGIDNYSKYGVVNKGYDSHPNYQFVEGNVNNSDLLISLIEDCEQVVAGAAMVGGINYFHELSYDLLAENERITASTFDAAIWAHKNKKLRKINVISSSMVFENTTFFPTPEGNQLKEPPPHSSYGFQKLSCEYFAKAAWEQYHLPFTIIRPFNCIGVGEKRALGTTETLSGNIKLAMSHVVPDLVYKILKGQSPIRLLGNGNQIRHFTYGGDLARGIRLCIENNNSINEDFNLSTPISTTILGLAKLIWDKINPGKAFDYTSAPALRYDVQKRIPCINKAKRILGFEAKTTLVQALDEIIPWVKQYHGL